MCDILPEKSHSAIPRTFICSPGLGCCGGQLVIQEVCFCVAEESLFLSVVQRDR